MQSLLPRVLPKRDNGDITNQIHRDVLKNRGNNWQGWLAGGFVASLMVAPWGVAMYGLELAKRQWDPLQKHIAHADFSPSHLRVGLLNGPTVSSPGPFVGMSGFEHSFVDAFVRRTGRSVEYVFFPDSAAAHSALAQGKIDIAPFGFTGEQADHLSVTSVNYAENPWIIIYSSGEAKPKSAEQLAGKTVHVQARVFDSRAFAKLRSQWPNVTFTRYLSGNDNALMHAVDVGTVTLALVESNLLEATQHVYKLAGKGVTLQESGRAWLTRSRDHALNGEIHHFMTNSVADRTVIQLKERHFGHTLAVNSFDARVFEERVAETLPTWRGELRKAQEETGIDWRLIASLAYQESQWQAKAVSYTGVWGFMQLTQDTANMYRVDRSDPNAAIAAGAKHLAYLHRATPDHIAEPDRTWFALAAYNIGLGHVNDARILAQRANLNPDSWADVKTQLWQLTQPKVAVTLKHGLARGYEALEYVDRIRSFYEMLVRLENPHSPKKKPLELSPKPVPAGSGVRTASAEK
jgi:membrane-bound lytic murein transglycosylase F